MAKDMFMRAYDLCDLVGIAVIKNLKEILRRFE